MKKLLCLVLVLAMLFSLIACGKTDVGEKVSQETVDEAADMIYEFNKPGEDNSVAANFTRVSKTEYDGFDMDVKWEVLGIASEYAKVVDNGNGTVTVNVNKYSDEDREFTLRATVECDGVSKSVDFKYVIKQFIITPWSEWAEKTKDATMNIKGVISAKTPYNTTNGNASLYLEDLDGEHGYYAYAVVCTQAQYDTELLVGNVVEINGTTSIYNGFREMGKGCTYNLATTADGKVETAEVKTIAVDAQVLSDNQNAALDQYQGCLVSLTGFKVKSIDANNALNPETKTGSYYIMLEKDGKTLKSYISTSNNHTYDELVATLESLSIGYTVDVVGPLAWYNAPQLYPMPGGYTVVSKEVSAEDTIKAELAKISFPANVKETTEITLPTSEAVGFAWEVTGEGAEIVDDKLVLTLGEASSEVTLKLTVTCGETTETKEYVIKLVVGDMTYEEIVEAAYKLEENTALDGTFRLYGKVVKIDTPYSEQYGNITVTIQIGELAEKTIQCFRMKGEGAAEIAEGDMITVEGKLKNYKGTVEFDSGCAFLGKGEIIDPVKIVNAAYALEQGEVMEGTQTLTGKITSIDTAYSEQYGNITVTIAVEGAEDKPIQCFRMKGEGIATLAVDQVITVTGTLKNYKGTVEFDAGCQLVVEMAEATATEAAE